MTRRTKPDHLLQILSSLKAIAPDWRTANIGYEKRQVLTIDRMRWIINYQIHALYDYPRGPYKPWLRSSVTLWPSSRARRDRQGWRARLRQQGWYRRCQQELARHGYHGEWLSSPYGRFGTFWRRLRNTDALSAELRRLDLMQLQTPKGLSVSFGDPSPRSAGRKAAVRRRAGADMFFELWSSFPRLQGEWWTSSFTLQKRESLTVVGSRWRAYYRIQVQQPPKLWLGAFIELWPSLRSVGTPQGWHPRLLKQNWYERCANALARQGYEGKWQLWDVRHGQFHKRLAGAKAAAVELKRLDRLQLP